MKNKVLKAVIDPWSGYGREERRGEKREEKRKGGVKAEEEAEKM